MDTVPITALAHTTFLQIRKRIESHWQPDKIEVLSPDTEQAMLFTHIDGKLDRLPFVWWD